MDMIARVAPAYELTEARRFTHAWERDASLRLREGDESALGAYRKHGRIIDGGPLERTDRITLPAKYVAEELALSYACTVHAAEGLTVATSKTVVTPRTGRAALYTAVTRGRSENHIFANTQAIAEDAPTGTVNHTRRQDPLGMLAANIERDEPDLAAVVQAEHDTADAASLATIGERFADVAEQATAGRTATMLDRLVDDGTRTPGQRATLAADEGTVSLAQVLRQAEIAGDDPDHVLRDAITSRDLGDARSLASVIHHRITDTVDLHPAGDKFTDWVPKLDNPVWQRHLHDLARLADARRSELGEQVAHTRPQWAVDALGPVPAD